MKKHKFNIFPSTDNNEYQMLISDMRANGYDKSQPIVLFENAIIDGWHRYLVCQELGIAPTTRIFLGSQAEAIDFVMRTNKRRNLNSGQWACIANEAEEMIEALKAGAKAKQAEAGGDKKSETYKKSVGQQIAQPLTLPKPEAKQVVISPELTAKTKPKAGPQPKQETRTSDKLAKTFNTNKQYIKDAAKMKIETPEVFEQVKTGKLTITKAKKQVKQEQKKEEKETLLQSVVIEEPKAEPKRLPKPGEWWQLGKHLLYCGDTSSNEFIKNLPECAFAFADPPYNANAAEWDNNFNWKHDYLIEHAEIVVVTPGISSIFNFANITTMPYLWSMACVISNGMTRGAVGFGNWIYSAIFSRGSIHKNSQDIITISIKTSESEETTHKGRKPTDFLALLFDKFTDKGDTIIDPFLGSGQTLLVCEKIGRTCIGGEISPDFCAEIINRWETSTGEIAHVNSI
jgi:hypothetical protein